MGLIFFSKVINSPYISMNGTLPFYLPVSGTIAYFNSIRSQAVNMLSNIELGRIPRKSHISLSPNFQCFKLLFFWFFNLSLVKDTWTIMKFIVSLQKDLIFQKVWTFFYSYRLKGVKELHLNFSGDWVMPMTSFSKCLKVTK